MSVVPPSSVSLQIVDRPLGYSAEPRIDESSRIRTAPELKRSTPTRAAQTGLRAGFDGLVCLAIAVLAIRTYFVEGYMISTGSMAPALYGYHQRVICPGCGARFARGVAFDASVPSPDEEHSTEVDDGVTCPNCGQTQISAAGVPRNHGDQLLVFKPAYDLESPRRWEITVFRSPYHPSQAFVKRIVGLPGETMRVIGGDVYANGAICRKPLSVQRNLAIPVFDLAHEPDDPRWVPRWIADRPETGHNSGWLRHENAALGGFDFSPPPGPDRQQLRTGMRGGPGHRASGEALWLTYQHFRRSGGSHVAEVRLDPVPEGFELPESPFIEPVAFAWNTDQPGTGQLSVVGALDESWERRLRSLSTDEAYQTAIDQLAQNSRSVPVADDYGYNRDDRGTQTHPVRDLLISFRLKLQGPGAFAVELTDGRQRFRLLFDSESNSLSLRRADGTELRSAPLPAKLFTDDGMRVEYSLMDRQVAVALDQTPPFADWTYDAAPQEDAIPVPHRPVRLGAVGLQAGVRDLQLLRDVYYTRGRAKNAIDADYQLADDEYFMLGDNSPVSLDSRSWVDAAVPARLIVGKPFVVHLPSRPGSLRLGHRRIPVRLPDFDRIRFIR